jgi:hypothetical protein
MDKQTMINMLGVLGIEENQWTYDDTLTYIILEHAGNHYYDQFRQSIMFDTVKDLIKVKFYDSRLVSGRLSVKEKTTAKTFLIKGNSYGNVSIAPKDFDRFREPIVGDYLFVIDQSTLEEIAESKIVSITKSGKDKIIVIADDLILTNAILAYTFKESFEGGLPANNFVRALPQDDSIIMQYKPLTTHIVDQFIGFTGVTGFATLRDTTSPYSLI